MHCDGCGLQSRAKLCSFCLLSELKKQDYLTLQGVLDELKDKCICAYCVEAATDAEHVIPKCYGGDYTLPSCRECNLLAGSTVQAGFYERRKYIRTRIEKKYKGLLATQEWDHREIAEMGDTIRPTIANGTEARGIVIARLAFFAEMNATEVYKEHAAEAKAPTWTVDIWDEPVPDYSAAQAKVARLLKSR